MNTHSRINLGAPRRGVLQSTRPLSARGTAALEYATIGWEVFPAPPGQKKSHKSEEHSGAKWGKTTDPEEIRMDFRKWPRANVAIVTGLTSGIFVLEADTVKGHGVDGLASIEALEDEHGPLPETLMAISPSGSVHRYDKYPGPGIKIKNSVDEIAPGVDIRGDGGMVIAPPSIKPGAGEYKWLNDLPVADAPLWLIEAAREKPKPEKAKKPSSRASASDQAQATSYFEALGERENSHADADLPEIEAALMEIPNNAAVNWQSGTGSGWRCSLRPVGRASGLQCSTGGRRSIRAMTPMTPKANGRHSKNARRPRSASAPSSISQIKRRRRGGASIDCRR